MSQFRLTKYKIILTEICYDEENMQKACNYKQVADEKYLVELSNEKRKFFKQKEFDDRFTIKARQT